MPPSIATIAATSWPVVAPVGLFDRISLAWWAMFERSPYVADVRSIRAIDSHTLSPRLARPPAAVRLAAVVRHGVGLAHDPPRPRDRVPRTAVDGDGEDRVRAATDLVGEGRRALVDLGQL